MDLGRGREALEEHFERILINSMLIKVEDGQVFMLFFFLKMFLRLGLLSLNGGIDHWLQSWMDSDLVESAEGLHIIVEFTCGLELLEIDVVRIS